MTIRALNRRETLSGLLACAGAAAFQRTSLAQDIKAPAGDTAPLTELGMDLSAQQRAAGAAFLKGHVSVDTHSHPGRFFLERLTEQTPMTRSFGKPYEDQAIADLSAGNVSATLFCAVADMRLIETTPTQGLRAGRNWMPGEAYADYRRQLAVLKTDQHRARQARSLSGRHHRLMAFRNRANQLLRLYRFDPPFGRYSRHRSRGDRY
jgi:hypothetical protein